MTLKERLEIVKEYRKWFDETNGKNDFELLDCPETLMAFLQNKGLLNERPKGKWIKWNFKTFGALGDWEYKCSNCEKVYSGEYNFYPNCGADMRSEEE